MTRIIEKYTPMEIVGNEELQRQAKEEMLQRVKGLEKVEEIFTLPREEYFSITMVAELYEVEESEVFTLLGAEELEGELNVLVSRMDILRIGFLLKVSEVAQELRNQITNIRDAV
ncbi:hypothetical protein HMPREF3291_22505 [Bacillus sp. HMSC76G11]|nr:hypothetical protein HMPREF3291_22505 [Bacillus sp. HMSC76G11]